MRRPENKTVQRFIVGITDFNCILIPFVSLVCVNSLKPFLKIIIIKKKAVDVLDEIKSDTVLV